MFIFTRTLVTYARTIFKPRCCLNFQSMRTQAESTKIAHNMFGQIKMQIPWYINRHTLISKKRDGKPRIFCGQFVVVRVGVHQLSVSPNTSLLCFKSAVNSCMVIACPVWTARTYNHTHADPEKRSAIELSSRHLNEAIEISLDYPPQSVTIGIKHTNEKLDSWPKPVELQQFMSTLLEYSPSIVVDRLTPNVPFRKCKWSVDSELENSLSACKKTVLWWLPYMPAGITSWWHHFVWYEKNKPTCSEICVRSNYGHCKV